MKWFKTTAFRYWLALTALSLLGTVSLAGVYIWAETRSLESAYRSEGVTVAKTLGSAIGLDLLKGDYSHLGNLSYAILEQPHVQYVIIRDVNGRVISRKSTLNEGMDPLIVKEPVNYFQSPVGGVEIALSSTELKQAVNDLYQYTGGIVLLTFLLAAVVSFFLSHRMTGSLQQLTRAAQRLTEGKAELISAPVEGSIEMEQLTAAFNQMAVTLSGHREFLEKEVEQATRDLSEKLETLQTMGEISSSVLASALSQEEVIDVILKRMKDLCKVEKISVYLWDWEGDGDEVHLYILRPERQNIYERVYPLDQTTFEMVVRQKTSIIRNNLASLGVKEIYPREKELLSQGIQALALIPLMVRHHVVGAISLGSREGNYFDEEIVEKITNVATMVAVAIDHARAFSQLEDAFFQTIRSLASALDFRDSYTGGHSEQVMILAEAFAKAIQLPESEINLIKFAGFLHDIGKIGIVESILQKPSKLTDNEFIEMKKHPVIGSDILRPVKMFDQVTELVHYHHERYDGKGYPEGRRGEDIPLGSRIIALADAIDAMYSDRPYRVGLSRETIRNELEKNSGTQFDPHLVEVILPDLDGYLDLIHKGKNE